MVIIIDYIAEGFKEAIRLLIGFDKEVYGIITLSLFVSTAATVIASLICIPLGIHLGIKDFQGKKKLFHGFYILL